MHRTSRTTRVGSSFWRHPSSFFAPGSRWYSSDLGGKAGLLTKDQILGLPSMPPLSPSYPRGPYRFVDREYFIVTYESDMDKIKAVVPQPLEPVSNQVLYEWIAMPDSSGFGSYQESGTVIPCTYKGTPVNYTAQMFLNDEPPIACGREIWGFPKKYAEADLRVEKDTLTGTLTYGGKRAATGTMCYKYNQMDNAKAAASLAKTSCNLKIIPSYDFSPSVTQLVAYNLADIEVKEAWEGPARLHLIPHVNARTADLPVRKVIGGKHIKANLTLPYGHVLHDYRKGEHHDASRKSLNGDGYPEDAPLTEERVKRAVAMPVIAPSYPGNTSVMKNREYMVISYHTHSDALRPWIPDLLVPSNKLYLSWVKTESSGLGVYQKMMLHAAVTYKGEEALYQLLSVVDCSSTITAGREIYGQPYKFGYPSLYVDKDTLYGELKYGRQEVASGSMVYKHSVLDKSAAYKFLELPEINLKLIPGANGEPEVAQLLSSTMKNIRINGTWKGPARLNLVPHVNAPIADFPVINGIEGHHIHTDEVTLPPAELLHDYLA